MKEPRFKIYFDSYTAVITTGVSPGGAPCEYSHRIGERAARCTGDPGGELSEEEKQKRTDDGRAGLETEKERE